MPFFSSVQGNFGSIGGRGTKAAALPWITSASGTVSTATSGGYKYYVFTGPGSLTVSQVGGEGVNTPSSGTLEVVIIGGGGGGGANGGDSSGTGGGAGGLVYFPSYSATTTTYPISIGGGGGSGAGGGNSTGFGVTALGGGAGASRGGSGSPGGNGGGKGSYSEGTFAGGTGLQPSQNPGVPGIYQIGNPSTTGYLYSPATATYDWNGFPYPPLGLGYGGSSNPGNDVRSNPVFPNSSTIISASPIGSNYIARGGYFQTDSSMISGQGAPAPALAAGAAVGPEYPSTSYGSGGRGTFGAGLSGRSGVAIVRHPAPV